MLDNATIATLPDSQGHNYRADVRLNQLQCDSTKPNEIKPSAIEPNAIKHESVIAKQKQKVIFIGLPRTGTTSVSVALLEQGLKVAHMAFTKAAFMQADAISDAPCFSDFKQLDKLFPDAKFAYLDRDLSAWVPSMQMLLSRMLPHLDDKTGRFHPIMKRSFRHSFGVGEVQNPQDEQHLIGCYQRHQREVFTYFARRNNFLSIDVSQQGALGQLLQFMAQPTNATPVESYHPITELSFPRLNIGRNVASWDEYKHPNKISANASGPDKRKFFDYKI